LLWGEPGLRCFWGWLFSPPVKLCPFKAVEFVRKLLIPFPKAVDSFSESC
jgi:hypothetical protein